MPGPAGVLVTGGDGQMGRALRACGLDGPGVVYTRRADLDLADACSITGALDRLRPALVINAAAYTDVDGAEREIEVAEAVNAMAPGIMAKWCATNDAAMLQVSTDYVFDGRNAGPYEPGDEMNPLGAYGRSKAGGEDNVRRALDRHVIVRLAWIHSPYGRNFLKTMLRLGGERDELSVVDDQHGTPGYAHDLARGLVTMVEAVTAGQGPWGTYHLGNAGETTWYGFAREIFARRARDGHAVPRLRAITTADYPTPARRPPNSVFDCTLTRQRFGLALPDWRDGVGRCMQRVTQQGASA